MLKKVLIIEDSAVIQEAYAKSLEDEVLLLAARNAEDAWNLFEEHQQDLAIIVWDGYIPVPTAPLIREFRDRFTGPMVAAAFDPAYRQVQVKAGCDRESDKCNVPKTVRAILGLRHDERIV